MADRKAHPSNVISSSLHSDAKKPSFSTIEAADPLWVPIPSPAFHETMVNFENMPRDEDDKDYDGCRVLQLSAKKRRLSPCQVQFLERSFDEENRLQPERKAQLAKELGLQPRQVAIWFQNRRAQFKTKQLEKEYSQLKDGCDKLKEQCDCLVKEKEQLKEELLLLKNKLLGWKEKQNSSDPLEPVNSGNISGDQKSNVIIAKQLQDQKPISGCKNEEETSAYRSSSVPDSGSPYFMDSNNQVLLSEPANTPHALEADCSDFSQEEGDCVFRFTEDWDQHLWSWPC